MPRLDGYPQYRQLTTREGSVASVNGSIEQLDMSMTTD